MLLFLKHEGENFNATACNHILEKYALVVLMKDDTTEHCKYGTQFLHIMIHICLVSVSPELCLENIWAHCFPVQASACATRTLCQASKASGVTRENREELNTLFVV